MESVALVGLFVSFVVGITVLKQGRDVHSTVDHHRLAGLCACGKLDVLPDRMLGCPRVGPETFLPSRLVRLRSLDDTGASFPFAFAFRRGALLFLRMPAGCFAKTILRPTLGGGT